MGIIAKVEVERDEKKRRIYDLNDVLTKMINEMNTTMNKQKSASMKSEMLEKEIEIFLHKQKANTLDIIKERECMKYVSVTAVKEANDIINREKTHNIAIDECSIASTPSVFTPVSENDNEDQSSLPFTPPRLLQTKSTLDHLIEMKERRKVSDGPRNDNDNNDKDDNMMNIMNALSELSPILKDGAVVTPQSKEHTNNNNTRTHRQQPQHLPPRFPHVINGSNGEDMADMSAFSTFTEDEDDEIVLPHHHNDTIDPKLIDFSKTALSHPNRSPFASNM